MVKLKKILPIILLVAIAGMIVFIATHRSGDAFSRGVVKAAQSSVTLMSLDVNSEKNITYYEFEDRSFTDEMADAFVSALNDNYGLAEGKVCVSLWSGSGALGRVFSVYNYIETESGYVMLDGFYRLNTTDLFIGLGMWGEPATYTEFFDNMIVLELPSKLQDKADEQGVDWHEAWPDLDEVVVYDTSDPENG